MSKRGYDDYDSQGGKRAKTEEYPPNQVHNAAAYDMQAQIAQYNQLPQITDEKLPESLASDPPSRVIHFRNVTPEIEQGDLVALCAPYGQVDHVLQMRQKNQCLLMFNSLKAAIEFMNTHARTNTQPTVKGKKLYAKFSTHQGITANNSAISNILLVTMEATTDPDEMRIPITTDVVWQMFQPYGTVQKIVITSKGPSTTLSSRGKKYQALIGYETQAMCVQAYEYLNDKRVYIGTDPYVELHLTVQYSHLEQLVVRFASATSVDYTDPASAAASAQAIAQLPGYGQAAPPPMPPPPMPGPGGHPGYDQSGYGAPPPGAYGYPPYGGYGYGYPPPPPPPNYGYPPYPGYYGYPPPPMPPYGAPPGPGQAAQGQGQGPAPTQGQAAQAPAPAQAPPDGPSTHSSTSTAEESIPPAAAESNGAEPEAQPPAAAEQAPASSDLAGTAPPSTQTTDSTSDAPTPSS